MCVCVWWPSTLGIDHILQKYDKSQFHIKYIINKLVNMQITIDYLKQPKNMQKTCRHKLLRFVTPARLGLSVHSTPTKLCVGMIPCCRASIGDKRESARDREGTHEGHRAVPQSLLPVIVATQVQNRTEQNRTEHEFSSALHAGGGAARHQCVWSDS